MSISAISRDWGRDPAIVRIVTTDTLATITTSGYLTTQEANIEALNFGAFDWTATDEILISYSGGEGFFTRNATTNTFVATASSPGSLSNTLASANIFVGNGANVATGVAMSGDATIDNTGAVAVAANAVTSAKTAANLIQYVEVNMTAAQWNGMYAAPVQLVAAAGANTLIVIDKIDLNMTFVAAAYAAGGVVAAQYDSTVHGAGSAASATIAAATVNGFAASSGVMVDGALAGVAFTASVNKGIYLSIQTGAFTTGDGTWKINVWYRVVPTV